MISEYRSVRRKVKLVAPRFLDRLAADPVSWPPASVEREVG